MPEEREETQRGVTVFFTYDQAMRLREMAGEAFGDGSDPNAGRDETAVRAMRTLEDAIERDLAKGGFQMISRFTRRSKAPKAEGKAPAKGEEAKELHGLGDED